MQVKGEGHIRWRVCDNCDHIWTIETDTYYVPAACIHLFSPQTYFQGHQQEHASFDQEAFVFHFACNSLSTLTLPYNKESNLPLAHLEHGCDDLEESVYPGTIIDPVVDEANVNLTQHEKVLMHWHYKLGHYFFKWIQALMKQGRDGQPL
eukprot:139129-Ditylum_brightwellii.AAC.1